MFKRKSKNILKCTACNAKIFSLSSTALKLKVKTFTFLLLLSLLNIRLQV